MPCIRSYVATYRVDLSSSMVFLTQCCATGLPTAVDRGRDPHIHFGLMVDELPQNQGGEKTTRSSRS